ncbi:MAG: hypothetical protein IPJ62_09520 [Betaproteobacteria bacterium]|nr:hypothetical protein [Betaproteobacteria bacterium]
MAEEMRIGRPLQVISRRAFVTASTAAICASSGGRPVVEQAQVRDASQPAEFDADHVASSAQSVLTVVARQRVRDGVEDDQVGIAEEIDEVGASGRPGQLGKMLSRWCRRPCGRRARSGSPLESPEQGAGAAVAHAIPATFVRDAGRQMDEPMSARIVSKPYRERGRVHLRRSAASEIDASAVDAHPVAGM